MGSMEQQGPISAPVAVKTLLASEKNAVPLQVQALHAILVRPNLTLDNYINLLFGLGPNPMSTFTRFTAREHLDSRRTPQKLIGVLNANGIVKGSNEYGHVPVDHRMIEYDHLMTKISPCNLQPRTSIESAPLTMPA